MWSKFRKNLLLMPIDSEDRDFTKIEDNLYLGNIRFAQNHHSLEKYGITLVIAVYPKNFTALSLELVPPDCRYHHIDVKDVPSEDLISHFDECFDLIESEVDKNEGKVLVYCGAGHSRSVTIMSAYLMKKYRISSEEAIERIRCLRKRVNPNNGFLGQLKLYEEMGYNLVQTYPEYRLFLLLCLQKKIWCESYWEDSCFGNLKRQFCEPMASYFHKLKTDIKIEPKIQFKCKDCNQKLFEDINVLSFIETDDQNHESNDCENIFIEPQNWMTSTICCAKRGDLCCPKCHRVLGRFKWKSFKCKCLLHNQLNASKVIKIKSYSVFKQKQ